MSETRTTRDPLSGENVSIRNDLVHRLRGLYAVGPTLPNGEPEFGWRQMGEPSSINIEAADEIERLRSALERLRATSVMLLQNAEQCVTHHHGFDMSAGAPGWLADAQAVIAPIPPTVED